ncbi:MAG: exopolyphosphatase [Candidatus Tectomicrobia bacterium]|uniref:Exopolyphosphatase n=1 Tax=Tectimicrobiota bacterium TaxID=2528274 RepID=A0A932I027_UNCTE|nr:exopolyphosphatase [Candidatus Tectomicrobia bacterium]
MEERLPARPPRRGKEQYRLLTRADLDGLASAVLLKEREMIREIVFVHPQDMQEGKVAVTKRDITVNLPYVKGAHLAVDHHVSEKRRVRSRANYINDPSAPSAARVLYRHLGGPGRFPAYTKPMMAAVDKADSGRLTMKDVLYPRGWTLLHFLLDPRTGLERFRNFRLSIEETLLGLSDLVRAQPIGKAMKDLDITERSGRYFVLEEKFREQLRRCATVADRIVTLDLRREDPIWPGNRFMIYALFPECRVSITLLPGRKRRQTEISAGKSIFDRSAKCNIGQILLGHGGGGHAAAGACQVPEGKADRAAKKIHEAVLAAG